MSVSRVVVCDVCKRSAAMVFNGYRFAAPKGWHERLDGLITCSRSCNGKAVRTTPRPDQMVRQAPTS